MTRVVGRGWATVESTRAEAELSDAGRIGPFEDANRSAILGARCRRARVLSAEPGGGTWVVVLEPDTEGRLAAFLARHGEGWAVTWSIDGDGGGGLPRPGPFGSEVLAPDQPPRGPFRLVVTAATIEP